MKDLIVQAVIDKLSQRSEAGIKKYGTTLHENNTDDFLNHLQEELMDAILYIEKLSKGIALQNQSNSKVIPELSDEEIEEMLFHHSNEYAYGFKDAIKWYCEQLKQRQ